MKINKLGYIEPELDEEFVLASGDGKVKVVKNDEEHICSNCLFYESECIFPCMNGQRDDKENVVYLPIK